MKTESSVSAFASAAASGAGTTGPEPDATETKLPEAEYLAQQAQAARAAMSAAWHDMKARLGQSADPREWAHEHPWIAVGAAAVAGFAAAAAVIPSREEQALRKIAALERALHPDPEPRPNGKDGKASKGGMLGTILHEAIGLLRPVIVSLMATHLGGSPHDGPAPGSPVPGDPGPVD